MFRKPTNPELFSLKDPIELDVGFLFLRGPSSPSYKEKNTTQVYINLKEKVIRKYYSFILGEKDVNLSIKLSPKSYSK